MASDGQAGCSVWMMVVVALGALLVPLTGGRLGALAEFRLGQVWTLPASLGLRILAEELPGLPGGVRGGLLVACYPIAGLFVLANRRLPGMVLVGLGATLNALAMSVNGGVMPASLAAQAAAGIRTEGGEFANSAVVPHPRLAFLGDLFSIPASWPLSNVVSIGDVLVVVGAVWGIHRICRSRPAAEAS